MASVRRKGRVVVVRLDPAEASVLGSLVEQVVELLTPPSDDAVDGSPVDPLEELVGLSSGAVAEPDDPALARLLPDGYRGDDERAKEFRRFTESDLRAAKLAALHIVTDGLAIPDRIRLDDDGAGAWLQALNDIRLAMGTRLDVSEDMAAEIEALEPGSPRWEGLALYDWLTGLQDSLVRSLPGD